MRWVLWIVRRTKWNQAIQVSVIASVGILAVIHLWRSFSGSETDYREAFSGAAIRNEESTPRSFVLPATPAVAIEQERQEADKVAFRAVAKCLWHLRAAGFDIPDNEATFNAKLVIAVFEFQKQNGLSTTGKLDNLTKEALQCTN
jgi:murein L,D-transpeptidase YcbB/YkuD